MLVYKDGDKDILGFICDMCTVFTSMDVTPNEHGEFRYICPRCGHHMRELSIETATKNEEEKSMVNTYTADNAASRLNVSKSTIIRGIFDGRFHDCFKSNDGYHGQPCWLIPSDQVEEWVTNGGFLQSKRGGKFTRQKMIPEAKNKDSGKDAKTPSPDISSPDPARRTVFDPSVGKDVAVVNFFEENGVISERDKNGKPIAGRYPFGNVVKRVAGPDGYHGRRLDSAVRTDGGDTDGDSVAMNEIHEESERRRAVLEDFAANKSRPAVHLRDAEKKTDAVSGIRVSVADNGDFVITIPKETIEEMMLKSVKDDIVRQMTQLKTAQDLLNDELKKLTEVIA